MENTIQDNIKMAKKKEQKQDTTKKENYLSIINMREVKLSKGLNLMNE